MIDTDPRIQRFMERLEDRPVLDVRALHEDVRRVLREIPTVRLGPQMEDRRIALSAKRSRLVGIKLDVLREHGYLVGARKSLEDYAHTRYASYFGGVRNDRGRRALLDRALAPIDRRIVPLRGLLEALDLVMADYDSRGFAFRDVVAASRRGDREL